MAGLPVTEGKFTMSIRNINDHINNSTLNNNSSNDSTIDSSNNNSMTEDNIK